MHQPRSIHPATFVLPAVIALLAGCDSKSADKAATQVVAKVNSAEISLHQVNHLLMRAGNVPADKIDQARKNVVDRLIDQELLAAKAVQAKLDRTPEILLAIELARREILARAYVEQAVVAGPKLTQADVWRYYEQHPELFSERHVFAMQEIRFPTPVGGLGPIQALVDQNAALEKIQDHLKTQSVAFQSASATRPAEQIPPELLKRLQGAKDGQLFVHSQHGQTAVVRVTAMRKLPVDETAAAPFIQRHLAQQRASATAAEELKKLKEGAKIEYMGAFAQLGTAK